ncbi:MAG TPA: methylamine utilization protein [Burkholderiales bacterium]|nr:methylamine utilization protein [Burkholderiales bacterium]
MLPRLLPLPTLLAACLALQPEVQAGTLHARVADAGGRPLADAVVTAVPAGARPDAPKLHAAVEDQIDREFVPYVQPIHTGTSVSFPNKDDIRHHVYSFSPAKTFELPLYAGTPASPVLFDKPGVVRLGCNIHDWMVGYLYVTDAPFFGKTSAQGSLSLEGLPPGTYTLKAWHPRMEGSEASTARQVEVRDGEPATVQWALKLRREFRPPRTPLPGAAGYR